MRFDPTADRLWLVGDLVNRGPRSVDVLRLVRDLGDRAVCVLGNHDLHLLAASCSARPVRRRDTFEDVLAAPDREHLLGWLAERPLVHHDHDLGFTLVHAGIPPQWSLPEAFERARELETVLRSESAGAFFHAMYGDAPEQWRGDLASMDRLRFITNAFTRMRFCGPGGELELRSAGPPGTQPPGYLPWYALPHWATRGQPIVFGHWASLSLSSADSRSERVYHVDSGCAWGRALTALDLETLERTSVSCAGLDPG